MLTLYENIKKRREELGLTKVELANRIGYERSMITKVEQGKVDLTQSKIAAFAKALETSPARLLGWEWDIVPMELSDIEANVISAYRESTSNEKHAVNKFLGVWDNPPEHEDDPTIELQKTVFWEKYYSLDERGRKMVDMVLEQEYAHSNENKSPDNTDNNEYPDWEPKRAPLRAAQDSEEYK